MSVAKENFIQSLERDRQRVQELIKKGYEPEDAWERLGYDYDEEEDYMQVEEPVWLLK